MLVSHRARKGFTLVELLVTISILAILATVSVVSYTSFIKNSAIEADESLVKQLNIFTDAYLIKHYANSYSSEEILKGVLDDSGVQPINLQSSKYGYDLWFKKSENKFELKENFTNNGDYIRVMGDIIIPPGSTTPTTTVSTSSSSPSSSSCTDKYPEDDPKPDDNTSTKFILKDFGNKPDSFSKNNYSYSENNCIYIGIQINDDNEIKSTTLYTKNIEIFEEFSDEEYRNWDIKSINYQNIKIFDIEKGEIEITSPGPQTIYLTLINPNTGEEILHPITMFVRNTYFEDAKIESLNEIQHTLSVSNVHNSSCDISLTIDGINDHLSIYDYNPSTSQTHSAGVQDQQDRLLPNMQIEIQINNESIIISGSDILNQPITKSFSGMVGNPNEITCKVIYRYWGFNGVTVEKEILVSPDKQA